jgi:hypothetical protein
MQKKINLPKRETKIIEKFGVIELLQKLLLGKKRIRKKTNKNIKQINHSEQVLSNQLSNELSYEQLYRLLLSSKHHNPHIALCQHYPAVRLGLVMVRLQPRRHLLPKSSSRSELQSMTVLLLGYAGEQNERFKVYQRSE